MTEERRPVHPYAAFLQAVQKPARYLGGEYQEVRKDPASVRARVCLAFPDTYEIGMSHLGTKILYSVLNKTDGIACERAFAPWVDMEGELRRRDLPILTLESATPLAAFDVLGFSLQYELTYTNVLLLLELGGLALLSKDRGDDAPLVLAGGPTATHPEPLAPFIDAFFIGEAEEKLPPLCLDAAELRRQGVPRRERLCRLAEKYPLYVPELYSTSVDPETGFVVVGEPLDPRVPRRPRREWVADINKFPFPSDSPLPFAEAIFDRMAVEIARGCTEGCRFCQAGMIYRPVRERDPVAVIDALVEGVRQGGYDETALTSLSTADYSCVTPLVKTAMAKLRDEKVALSVSSLRAYGLNDDLLADMATMKAQGLTFAPEAGTQRMRDVITKNVTEEDITESAERVFSRGFQRMKLYFMIGLPTEEDEDVLGIVRTAARVRDIGVGYFRAAMVTASVSTHVPKPHTPFQWAAMDSEAETQRKQSLLAADAQRLRVNLKMHECYQSHLEGIFSRGDRRCGELLLRAYRKGCRFDGWDDQLRPDLWEEALAEMETDHPPPGEVPPFSPERYLGTIPVTARLPWDHIDIGLEPDFLLKEYRKALKDRLSPPCGKPYKKLLHPASVAEATADRSRKLICYDCGVACDLGAMKDERLFFLRRMNAWSAPPAPAPAARRGQSQAPALRKKDRRPSTAILQGQARRYRLRFTKLGRVAYLGHLDLIRHLPRVFRRAGLELYYSEGFHPKPGLSFGPALGLGVQSLGELLDVRLVEDIEGPDLLARLNRVSLEGVRFLSAAKLAESDPALGRVITRADFAACLPEGIDPAVASERFAGSEELSLVRRTNTENNRPRLGRRIDLRRSLRRVGRPAPGSAVLLDTHFGWPAERVLAFSVDVGPEGAARPSEILTTLLSEEAAAGAQLVRVALVADRDAQGTIDPIDPLDLAALRLARPGSAPAPAA